MAEKNFSVYHEWHHPAKQAFLSPSFPGGENKSLEELFSLSRRCLHVAVHGSPDIDTPLLLHRLLLGKVLTFCKVFDHKNVTKQ